MGTTGIRRWGTKKTRWRKIEGAVKKDQENKRSGNYETKELCGTWKSEKEACSWNWGEGKRGRWGGKTQEDVAPC